MNIKFVTLNIWLGGKLFDQMVSFLKNQNADIVALQEVYNGTHIDWDRQFRSFEILKKELGLKYNSFAPHVADVRTFGKIEQGNAIFSKFPIVSEKTTFFDIPYGERSEETETDWSNWPCNLQHAEVDIDGKKLHVFNTHGPWWLNGSEETKRRLAMSKVIVEEIKKRERVILAGDFNVQPNTKTIENIERCVKNVFKGELKTSYNMKRKRLPGYATSICDMIFVSPTIQILDHSCPQVDVSDHLPLVSEFEL